MEKGDLGDVGPVGEGVSELRIFYGPGYRIYFIQPTSVSATLLCRGDKDTQESDIAKVKDLARRLEE